MDGMGMMVLGRGGWIDAVGLGLGLGDVGFAGRGRVREEWVRGICWLHGFLKGVVVVVWRKRQTA